MKLFGFAVLGLFAVGCAATTPVRGPAEAVGTTTLTSGETTKEAPAKQAPTTAAASGETPVALAAQAEPSPVPTSCVGEQAFKESKACLPPGDFVKKLCSASYPDVALALFAKGTPWTRAWLAGDVEAWNPNGGFTSRANLAFDEEVIVLSRHSAPKMGGIQMSGGAAFDILRWDGSCVSVQEGELTSKRPPSPKPAVMRWSRFEDATKRALLSSSKVKTSRDAFEKACSGDKSVCDRAEKDFSSTIASTVRSGATPLPQPTHRP